MATDIERLIQQSVLIRDEYRKGANTANRVGSLFLAICERLAEAFDLKELDKRYLRKDQPDSTKFLVKFFAGLEAGLYAAGGTDGSKLHEDGLAELGRLQVNGDSEFRGNLSSKDFISGFMTGKGWAIQMKKILNSAGVEEAKAVGELDDLIVRGTLRVFEFVVSQMLGENDNRVFTAMLEVDHYDPSTGKVWLNTQNGKLYNPFRVDDCIVVQQYNGMPSEDNGYYITKQYELVVTGVGIGDMSLGEDRLDWVTFKNFTTTMEGGDVSLITKGDTFVRWDNLSDPTRKGIIQMMTVGESTPYMDIAYGLKTDPDNAHKGRVGNLEGIYHHLFGWLESFGAYLINLYAVGDFRLRRTGESLDSKLEMLAGLFATNFSKLTYDITEETNYLKNASFTENLGGWSTDASDARYISSNGDPFLVNGSLMAIAEKIVAIEECEGRNRLRIQNASIRQANADIRKPGTHKVYASSGTETSDEYTEEPDKLYLSIKFLPVSSGTLTLGFVGASSDAGSLPLVSRGIDRSNDWQTIQVSGTWDGKGDFVLSYTGNMYVSLLALTADPLSEFKSEVSTSIEQTATNIRLLGTNINNVKGTVTQLGVDLDAAEERISIYATKTDNLEGSVTDLGVRIDAAESNITIHATKISGIEKSVTNLSIRLDAAEENISIYATKVNDNAASISALSVDIASISSTVAGVQGDLSEAKRVAAAASQAAKDRADEAYNNSNSAWLAANAAQASANTAQGRADDAYNKSVANATAITQNASSISAIAGLFDSNGHLLEGSGWVTTSSYNSLYSMVTGLDGKIAAKAEMSTSVQYDPSTGKVTSGIKMSADKISLEGLVTANQYFKILTDGSIEVNKGTFNDIIVNGSLAETPKALPGGTSLDFSTGFNFAGYTDSTKTLVLPTDSAYNGVRCTITNTKNNGGYFIIKCNGNANFMYSTYNATMLESAVVHLYGIGDLRLRAVKDSNNTLRWFIENDSSFSYDWSNKVMTNGKGASMTRLINVFSLKVGTLTKLYCSDNNDVKLTNSPSVKDSSITWEIGFTKSRSGHKKLYLPMTSSDFGSLVSASVKNISNTGFTVQAGCISLLGNDPVNQTTITVCIFEYS